MTDIMTPEQRARCMRHIRSKNTKPEIIVRKFLFSTGLRFRINVRRLPGSPDIVLRKYKTVIFVNGCFWHGHDNCELFRLPKSNVDFWKQKIERNRQRDQRVNLQLRNMGWNVITIWECQLKISKRQETLERLLYTLNHIFLLNHKAQIYVEEEENSIQIAAENEAIYEQKDKFTYTMKTKPHYHVVAAVIQHGNDVLCMQRGKTPFPYTSFKFEFPGGKVEKGESPEEALHREIHEEMAYDISIKHLLTTVEHDYPDFSITMQAFVCTATDRKFTLKEHHAFRWLPTSRLLEIDWAAADLPIARKLAEH